MKLWLLRPINPDAGPWDPWYDRCFGFVVRAKDESAARALAAEKAGAEWRRWCEDPNPWLYPAMATCIPLEARGEPEVIIEDFHWA